MSCGLYWTNLLQTERAAGGGGAEWGHLSVTSPAPSRAHSAAWARMDLDGARLSTHPSFILRCGKAASWTQVQPLNM